MQRGRAARRAPNGWSPGGAAGPGGNQSAYDLHVKVSPG